MSDHSDNIRARSNISPDPNVDPDLNDGFNRSLRYSLGLHLLFFILTIFFIPRLQQADFGLTEVALFRESAGPARGAEVTDPISRPRPKAVQPKEKSQPTKQPVLVKAEKTPAKPAKTEIKPAAQTDKEIPLKEKAVQPSPAVIPASAGIQSPSSTESAIPQPPSGIKGASGTGTALEKSGIEGPAAKRRILYLEYPEYPAWARARGIEMETTVRFWVGPDGKVKNVETVRRSGWLDVDQEVENKVYKWLFEPIPADLKQEDQWGQVAIKFRLTD